MVEDDADKLDTLLRQDIHAETARIPWKDLQRFFAGGKVIQVAAGLDLVDVALQFSADNRSAVENWIARGLIAHVSDQQARRWIDTDASVWAVVVKPWVLVQQGEQQRGERRVH